MKKNQFILGVLFSFLLFIFTSFFSTQSKAHEIPDDKIRFNYLFGEGETYLDCTHTRAKDTHDWNVQCLNAKGEVAYETTVHLILRTVKRTETNETHLEFHFWTESDSQSLWLTLENGQVGVKQLITYLGVQNESAFLRLQINF